MFCWSPLFASATSRPNFTSLIDLHIGSDRSHSFTFLSRSNSPQSLVTEHPLPSNMKFFSTVAAVSALAGVALAVPRGPPSRPTFATLPTAAPSSSVTTDSPSTTPSTTAPSTSTTTVETTTSTTTTAAASTVTCLTDSTASYLVDGFGSLLTAYSNATAEAILASDFTDTSDSINWLAGYPLGSTTFPSKLAFELGQGSLPPIGFQVLSIDAVTCTVIAFRWQAFLGGSPVKGINIIYASNLNGTTEGWQIETNFSEFNSGLWLQEIGGTCTKPGSS